MSRYKMTRKIRRILEARDYELVCKVCSCPLQIGDMIESKQQRRGKSKLYHALCYDGSELDIPNGEHDDEELKTFFARPLKLRLDGGVTMVHIPIFRGRITCRKQ